ncbi:hypothetical protein [Mesorhizobium xinjiangense]|uniref:hypothetical protein n=1 Tax=Mesorhizobium xinjiangense TaxID=2678685 RepID=UPI0012EE6F6A|nr:hypothetical protein [Mesorhizobium xinjiangense]
MQASEGNGRGSAIALRKRSTRGRLVRRLVMFQFKLMADGFRDVVMSPLSLAAGVIGIIAAREPELFFDRLMHFGRDTDRWINLFNEYDDERQRPTLDGIAEGIEDAIRRDYEQGGMSAAGAERLQRLSERLRQCRRA